MGSVHTRIGLRNPRREELRELEVPALVDTGSNHLCLPAAIVAELGLETHSNRTVKTADGSVRDCHYVGPVRVRFENRECFVGALELGDTVLVRVIPVIPMEDMDLAVNPAHQTLTVNPEYPDTPHALAISAR